MAIIGLRAIACAGLALLCSFVGAIARAVETRANFWRARQLPKMPTRA